MAIHRTPPLPGTRVRVTQQVPLRDTTWQGTIEGVVIRFVKARTGAWYAHARGGRYWLDRLELRLDDGERTLLILDDASVITPIEEGTRSREG